MISGNRILSFECKEKSVNTFATFVLVNFQKNSSRIFSLCHYGELCRILKWKNECNPVWNKAVTWQSALNTFRMHCNWLKLVHLFSFFFLLSIIIIFLSIVCFIVIIWHYLQINVNIYIQVRRIWRSSEDPRKQLHYCPAYNDD